MRKWFSYILLGLAVLAGGPSCEREREAGLPGGERLQILPRLLRQSAPTKAKDDTDLDIRKDDEVNARDDLRENYFRTLDVFVKRQSDAESAAWFRQYHLTEVTENAGMEQIEHLLAENWAQEGYVPGVKYDIYATANNPHTASGVAPASLQALKALTTNKPFLYKYYSPSDPGNGSNFITIDDPVDGVLHKSFLMDGKIEGWQVDPNAPSQVFDMDLSRAAAKILLLVRFDGDSDNVMIADEKTKEPKLDDEHRVVYGSLKEYLAYNHRIPGLPRAKYVRFNFTTSDIADGGYEPAKDELLTDPGNFVCIKEGLTDAQGNPLSNVDDQYVIVTYCYPFSWDGEPERIPYILLSVFYSRDDDPKAEQTRSYYRIPVCDEAAVTGLERNKIYIVDVLLSSMGYSNESVEAQDEELRIEYHVIPWTQTNMTQEATTVRLSDTKYLMVTPQEYILKGDGRQSVDLQYFASVSTDDGRYVDLDQNSVSITYVNKDGNTVSIKGSVTKQVRQDNNSLVTATDANTDGRHDIVYTFTAPASGTANGEKVIITITPAGVIRVESDALSSRAIKDIEFDVQLLSSGLGKEHVKIRHFPLDNIQSIEGSWSSRWDGVDNSLEYSFNPTADGWTSWDGYEDNIECTLAEYNSASDGKSTGTVSSPVGTPSDYDSRSEIESGGDGSSMQTAFRNAVPQNSRYGANSEANAYHDTATDYWYWGEGRVAGSTNNYDWRDNGNSGTRRRWTTYYRRKFYKNVTAYFARRYYRRITNSVPDTGTWVAWGEKNGTTSEGIFTAKVYYNGQCYPINTYNTMGSGNNYTNLTNNHMYVIQITSTSDQYVLGKPVMDSNYQSQDKVASPAFMIASQLGAVTTTNSGTTAATHCGTYMEVGTDGTRYVGWRLPTEQEISVIIDYQKGEYTSGITMVTVLGGDWYWALNGNAYATADGSSRTSGSSYVRCVRDLSVAEIEKLNHQ